ncbi:MAG: ATP-binding protein [Eubacterium sp.]|nr:ATP-binding protein [Eubacterium sp.]
MAYKSEVYQKAINVLERRRERATLEANARTLEISREIPEIEEIQRKLSAIGFSISKLFFREGDKEEEVNKLRKASLALQKEKRELLAKNGYDEDALTIKYFCPVCNDTGYYNEHMCSCHRELLKEIQRDQIRKLAPLDECTFESFDTRYYPEKAMENGISPKEKAERILESCRNYAQKFNSHSPNLMFMGGTGVGKTHLSLAIANVAINKGYSVVYGTSQNILSDLQNENFGRTENLTYEEFDVLHTDLLIIDDLGTEFSSRFSEACIYNIINTRILQRRPTVISTNYEHEDFEREYNQRILSRIAGEYSTLILEGNDIRYIK